MRSLGTPIFMSDFPALVLGRFAARLCTVEARRTSIPCLLHGIIRHGGILPLQKKNL
jgi:hypothetical protein